MTRSTLIPISVRLSRCGTFHSLPRCSGHAGQSIGNRLGVWLVIALTISTFVFYGPIAGKEVAAADPSVEKKESIDVELTGRSAEVTSLKLAPEDADFYFGSFAMDKQFERFAQSQLYHELQNNALLQKIIGKASDNWKNKTGQFGEMRSVLDNENARLLLKYLQQLVAQEVFYFGDKNCSDAQVRLFELADEITKAGEADQSWEVIATIPKAEFDLIPVPTIVIGSHHIDREATLNWLDQIEAILKFGLGQFTVAKSILEGLSRVEDDRGTRLVWEIDLHEIPWFLASEIGFDSSVIEHLRHVSDGRYVCITIGILDDYVIASISEDAAAINELGMGRSLLQNVDVNRSLQEVEGVFSGLMHYSDAMAVSDFQVTLKDFFSENLLDKAYEFILPYVEDDELEVVERLQEDLNWLDDVMEDLVPEPRGTTEVFMISDRGYESLQIGRTESVLFDSSRPLNILRHVGSSPIAFLAFRLQDHPEYFATARKVFRRSIGYLELIADSESLPLEQRSALEDFVNEFVPLIRKGADLWEMKVLPTLKDGQHAWCLTSGNMQAIPKLEGTSASALPIPEMCLISKISNKESMNDVMKSTLELVNEMIAKLQKLPGSKIPSGVKIPSPRKSSVSQGDSFTYPIPIDDASLAVAMPKEIMPSAVVADQWVTFSYGRPLTIVCSEDRELRVGSPLIDNADAQAVAAYIDFDRLIRSNLPWMSYAFLYNGNQLEEMMDSKDPDFPDVSPNEVIGLVAAFQSIGELMTVTTSGDRGSLRVRTLLTLPQYRP